MKWAGPGHQQLHSGRGLLEKGEGPPLVQGRVQGAPVDHQDPVHLPQSPVPTGHMVTQDPVHVLQTHELCSKSFPIHSFPIPYIVYMI